MLLRRQDMPSSWCLVSVSVSQSVDVGSIPSKSQNKRL